MSGIFTRSEWIQKRRMKGETGPGNAYPNPNPSLNPNTGLNPDPDPDPDSKPKT